LGLRIESGGDGREAVMHKNFYQLDPQRPLDRRRRRAAALFNCRPKTIRWEQVGVIALTVKTASALQKRLR
jgi:hypothetical protein